MEFKYRYVSRIKRDDNFTYDELDKNIIGRHILIINCTPVGSQPKSHEFPFIPYQYLTADHLLFDLVYNPRQTEFMKMGFAKGARVTNGLKMLEYQAKKAWTIWKK
jgi:shikimate dehydrogenase